MLSKNEILNFLIHAHVNAIGKPTRSFISLSLMWLNYPGVLVMQILRPKIS